MGEGERTKRTRLIPWVTAAALLVALAFVLVVRPQHWREDVGTREQPEAASGNHAADASADVQTAAQEVDGPPEDIARDLTQEVFEVAELQTREKAHASPRVPPHPWDQRLVRTMSEEDIEQTVANLGGFDDVVPAIGTLGGGMMVGAEGSFELLVTRLRRVRRLLEEGRAHPQEVVPVLRERMAGAIEEWPAAREAFIREMKEKGGVRNDGSEPWSRCRGQIRGGTYLLAELGDHDSLPLLMRACKGPEWPRRWRGAAPCAMTLYAMHRLVLSYPEQRLASEAKRLRDEYLLAAKCLPEPALTRGTAWRAKYSESDPRLHIFDPSDKKVLEGEPTIDLPVYPHLYSDGAGIGAGTRIPARTQELFAKLEAFISAAYPQE